KLFKRVKTLWDKKDHLNLDKEQARLLELEYKAFVRSGANLSEADKEQLRALNGELSLLSVKYGNNVLSETNAYELILTDEKDLAGLPANLIEAAARTAKAKGK